MTGMFSNTQPSGRLIRDDIRTWQQAIKMDVEPRLAITLADSGDYRTIAQILTFEEWAKVAKARRYILLGGNNIEETLTVLEEARTVLLRITD